MAFQIKALTEELHGLQTELDAVDKGRMERSDDAAFTGDEQAKWDDLSGKIGEVRAKLATAERLERADFSRYDAPTDGGAPAVHVARPAGDARMSRDDGFTALAGILTEGTKYQTADMRRAMGRSGLAGGDALEFRLAGRAPRMERDIETATPDKGGHLIQELPIRGLEKALLRQAEVRAYANVVRTDTGNPYPIADVEMDGNVRTHAEGEQIGDASWTIGKRSIGCEDLTTGIAKVSLRMLRDSPFSIEAELGNLLERALVRKVASKYAVGGGAGSEFGGLFPGAADSGVECDAAGPTLADLLAIEESVGREYRKERSCVWVMNSKTLSRIKGLTDANGTPLFLRDLRSGEPGTLLGYPVAVDDYAPDYAAGEFPVVFGDLGSSFMIRDVRGVEVTVLRELFRATGQVGVLATFAGASAVTDISGGRALVKAGVAA